MNAVACGPPRIEERAIPGRDLSWIDACFRQWGEWIWKNRDFEGYPTADAVAAAIMGAGGNRLGSRVLCKDMPKWIAFTHVLYLLLPEHEAIAVYAEYVPGVRDDGRLWTLSDKCSVLQITEEAFWKRLQRAKRRIWEWERARRN